MQIKFKSGAAFQKERDESIPQYVDRSLNANLYDDGVVEATQQKCQEIGRAFGRLIETLAENKFLSASEITYIAEGVYRDEAEISTLED